MTSPQPLVGTTGGSGSGSEQDVFDYLIRDTGFAENLRESVGSGGIQISVREDDG